MTIPKAAWWLVVSLAWTWQYLVYVPAYIVTNLVIDLAWALSAWFPFMPGWRWNDRPHIEIEMRP